MAQRAVESVFALTLDPAPGPSNYFEFKLLGTARGSNLGVGFAPHPES